MADLRQVIGKIRASHTPLYLLLSLLLLIFISLHFIGLSTQEFNGDEAAPLLLIDRMLDAFNTGDLRFLAYPFLFYSDPFRAFISGTMLHLFGPDRVLLRIPSILEAVATVSLMFYILRRYAVSRWLTVCTVAAYAFSGVIINNRTAAGDSFMRLAFLSTTFLLMLAQNTGKTLYFIRATLLWVVSFFTMLNAVVLVPVIVGVGIQLKVYKERHARLILIGIALFVAAYLCLWLYLPYQAYLSGFQEHYINRGLFYYLIRAGEGVATATVDPFNALLQYTSPVFVAWILWAGVYQLRVKQFPVLRWVHFSIWLFVLLLSHTSFHIIMFLPVLVVHAALMSHVFIHRHPQYRVAVTLGFLVIVAMNLSTLFSRYSSAFSLPTDCPNPSISTDLDESVRRMYTSHGKIPLYQPCGNIIVQ